MNPKYNIQTVLPGIGRAFFIKPSQVNAKGGAEKHIPSLGKHVVIPANCISAKGGAEKYVPGLGKYFYVNPVHIEVDTLAVALEQAEPVDNTVTVTSVVTGGVELGVTKYLSGTKVAADFASAGTEFTSTFVATANGAVTVYAKDILGNEAVSTITVAGIV